MSDEEAKLPDETPNNSFLITDKGMDELYGWVKFQLALLGLTEETLWEQNENGEESIVYEARTPLLVFLALIELRIRRVGEIPDRNWTIDLLERRIDEDDE